MRKKYRATVQMRRTDFKRANRLLSIKNLGRLGQKTIKETGAREYDERLLYSAHFENGVKLDQKLYSGMENYYTSPSFLLANGEFWAPEDCADFTLSQVEEFLLGDDEYIVNIELTEPAEEWVILAQDGDGKIHFYRRVTENEQLFVRDVRALPQRMNILALYRQEDVVSDGETLAGDDGKKKKGREQ